MKVLVTGTTWGAGLAVVHGLARAGHDVIGVDNRDLRFKVQSRFLRNSYRLPIEEKAFITALVRTIRTEKPDLLLPVNETRFIVHHKETLQNLVPFLVPDPDSYENAFDNARTMTVCRRLGIAAPRVLSTEEAMDFLCRPKIPFPKKVVLKPRADVGGARGICYIDDAAVLPKLRKQVEAVHGPTFLQEYIPGRDAMRTVNLLFDRHSALVAYFTMRKLRQWPLTGGVSILAESTRDLRLVEAVLPLFQHWQWKGPAEVELKVDPRDGQAKIIEVNPRFPGYIGFPIQCGADFPRIICDLMQSRQETRETHPNYTVGAKYLQLGGYAKTIWWDLRQGRGCADLVRRIRSDLNGRIYVNYSEWRDWPVLLSKALTRYRPAGEGGTGDVRN